MIGYDFLSEAIFEGLFEALAQSLKTLNIDYLWYKTIKLVRIVKGAGLIASALAIFIGILELAGLVASKSIPAPLYLHVITDGILYIVLGVGMLLAMLPLFYAIVVWATAELIVYTYLAGIGTFSAVDPALLAPTSSFITGLVIILVALSGYYIGKIKASK